MALRLTRSSSGRAWRKRLLLLLLLEELLLLNLLLLSDLRVDGDLGGLAIKNNFRLLKVATGI